MVYVRNPKWCHGVGSQNNADVGCEKKNPFTALAKQNHVTNFGGLVLNRIEAEIHKPCITKTFVEMYKMYAPLQRSNLKNVLNN